MDPTNLTGYLCEQCLDAPAACVPALWGARWGSVRSAGSPPPGWRRTVPCAPSRQARTRMPTSTSSIVRTPATQCGGEGPGGSTPP